MPESPDSFAEQMRLTRIQSEVSTRLMDILPDAIIAISQDGKIVHCNERAELWFGWNRRELIGQEMEMLVPPELRDRHREHRKKYFADPQLRMMGLGYKLEGYHRDGTRLPVEIQLSPQTIVEHGLHATAIIRKVPVKPLGDAGTERSGTPSNP